MLTEHTVSEVLKRAVTKGICYPLPADLSDVDLHGILFPEKANEKATHTPDFEQIHKEMGKSDVTLSLLWDEYCAECSTIVKIPLGYSQYCRLYHKYAHTTKTTMHITHKPGEQLDRKLNKELILKLATCTYIILLLFIKAQRL